MGHGVTGPPGSAKERTAARYPVLACRRSSASSRRICPRPDHDISVTAISSCEAAEVPTVPAMAFGVNAGEPGMTDRLWSIGDMVKVLQDWENTT
jgi:hypothetical protein